MTTIATKGDFKVMYNGSNTYFVIDNTDNVWYRVSSQKVAINKLNKIA